MPEAKNGGIAAAERCAETISQWHRIVEWAGWPGTAEARFLSRADRRWLMEGTDWRNNPDPEAIREAIEDEAREWPLEVSVRCSGWYPSGSELPADEFRIVICTGGPAVQVVGDLNCADCPINPELQGQDWATPWQPVDCDSEALAWFCELFSFDC